MRGQPCAVVVRSGAAVNAMVHFTEQDGELMAFHVGQIRAIERAHLPDCVRVILCDKFEGRGLYWTLEPYQVIRDRLSAAEADRVEDSRMSTTQEPVVSLGSSWLAEAGKSAQAHLDFYAGNGCNLCDHKITIQPAKGPPEPFFYLARCSCGWGQV